MKTLVLLFIWCVVELVLWISTVLLVVNKEVDESVEVSNRNQKYLKVVKTISYVIAILVSLPIDYLLKV